MLELHYHFHELLWPAGVCFTASYTHTHTHTHTKLTNVTECWNYQIWLIFSLLMLWSATVTARVGSVCVCVCVCVWGECVLSEFNMSTSADGGMRLRFASHSRQEFI